MRYWRGKHVAVEVDAITGEVVWRFHSCLCCDRTLSDRANQSGYGPTCIRGLTATERDIWRRRALAEDRRRYRQEVSALGFEVAR